MPSAQVTLGYLVYNCQVRGLNLDQSNYALIVQGLKILKNEKSLGVLVKSLLRKPRTEMLAFYTLWWSTF